MSKEQTPFLRDYQLDAVNKGTNGCIFNGGVGSGKSRTGLYYYFKQNGGRLLDYENYTPMHNPPQDLYIITTAMKRDSCEWDGELANFYISTDPTINQYDQKIVIDSWNNIKKYITIRNAFFVFDEDKVTGSGAWVKAFWNIAHAVFKRYSKWPQIEKYINTGRLIRLRDKILINMDFERLTIPHHMNVYTDYDVETYKKVMKTRWNPYKDEPIAQASVLCGILRQIVNSDESRVDKMLDILETKNTAIIFYNFNYELDILHNVFWNAGNDTEACDYDANNRFEVAEWNGHMHQEIPRGNKWVYLVQYTAGCEGWNCITTDTIIFFSQNYSYKVVTQAAGRIDRLNSPYIDLYYYHLKSRASIDIAISRALTSKKEFNAMKWCNSRSKQLL